MSYVAMSISRGEDLLTHAGVKGMKWGKRKSEYKSASKGERAQMRADHSKAVGKARLSVAAGKADNRMAAARDQYKADKINLGKDKAKAILNKERNEYKKVSDLANSYRNRGEVAAVVASASVLALAVVYRAANS